ncbi:hypothetical protein ACM66B_005928 [Microbotryomycetes sp. NB124-2]
MNGCSDAPHAGRSTNPFLSLQQQASTTGQPVNGASGAHVLWPQQQVTPHWTGQVAAGPAPTNDVMGSNSFMQRMMPQHTGRTPFDNQEVRPDAQDRLADASNASTAALAPPPLPRRPRSSAYDQPVQRDSLGSRQGSRFSLLNNAQPGESDAATTSANATVRKLLQSALESIIAAHEQDMFQVRHSRRNVIDVSSSAESAARSGKARARESSAGDDQMTEDFVRAFPSLSRPSSPVQEESIKVSNEGVRTSNGAVESSFKSRVDQIADMLSWQVSQQIDSQVAESSRLWQQERARGMAEMSQAEDEMDTLRERATAVEEQLVQQRRAHDQDLQAAAQTASELSERVEVLQTALNESRPSASRPAEPRPSSSLPPSYATSETRPGLVSDGADAWADIINEQASAIRKFEQAISSMEPSVTCIVCTGPFVNPCTLPCGHSGCLECLQGWLRLHSSCPACREPALVGEAMLRTNVALEGIVQILRSVEVADG